MIPIQRQFMRIIVFISIVTACVLTGLWPAQAEFHRSTPTIAYTVRVAPEDGPWIDVEMTVTADNRNDNAGIAVDVVLPDGASVTDVTTVSEATDPPVRIEPVSAGVVHVSSETFASVAITYRLRLPSGMQNPASSPSGPFASVHLGDYVYVAGRDALARIADPEGESVDESGGELVNESMAMATPVTIDVVVPDDWHAFALNIGPLRAGNGTSVDDADELILLLGPLSISQYDGPAGRLTFVAAGELPWDVADAAASVQAIVEPLRERTFTPILSELTFIHIRYPGALRINPLISSHVVFPGTIIHWVGTGGLDWWRKHAARDIVGLLVEQTITVAPDASWFVAALPEYGGLLLLHEAGFMTVDDMYRALRTLYATGVHYTGPGWPSLVLASVTSPRSHAARRVLQFRAPLVAFLLDAEIRAASGGDASLLHIWADLAEEQRRNPEVVFHTAALLPPPAVFGDLTEFAEDFLFGSRIPPAHFDAVFQRWVADRR